jgi:hypothetical protein
MKGQQKALKEIERQYETDILLVYDFRVYCHSSTAIPLAMICTSEADTLTY